MIIGIDRHRYPSSCTTRPGPLLPVSSPSQLPFSGHRVHRVGGRPTLLWPIRGHRSWTRPLQWPPIVDSHSKPTVTSPYLSYVGHSRSTPDNHISDFFLQRNSEYRSLVERLYGIRSLWTSSFVSLHFSEPSPFLCSFRLQALQYKRREDLRLKIDPLVFLEAKIPKLDRHTPPQF